MCYRVEYGVDLSTPLCFTIASSPWFLTAITVVVMMLFGGLSTEILYKSSILQDLSCHSYFIGDKQVSTILIDFPTLPTTSTIKKGQANVHHIRVDYSILVLTTIYVMIPCVLSVSPVISPLPSICDRFIWMLSTRLDPTISSCLWQFRSSPRSVLDVIFQCEAVPICLVERSTPSLVKALHLTLAGKLLTTNRPLVANLTAFASRLWNCTHRLSCYDHGKCLYSFEFTYAPDVEKVVAGSPWYINGDLLLISRMNPNQSIEQLPFSFTKLWVRCYDLPPKCFTKNYAEAIGNSLGKFCETDLPPEDSNEAILLVRKIPTVRKYLRVKFNFNLHGPLKSSQSIQICNVKKVVVEEHLSRLTYERLPHICFRCGHLGHLIESCSYEGPTLYGEWIRDENFYRHNFQHNSIQKAFSNIKEGQSSSSQGAANMVPQVSNVADLVNTMLADPSIIRADYSLARKEGNLPISKGKAPMLPTSQINSLVPYNGASPNKKSTPTTVFGPVTESIMGSCPLNMQHQGSPFGPDSILVESDEGHFATYFNSSSPHENLFSPTNRCLFKPELVHHALSSISKAHVTSPMLLSPIKPTGNLENSVDMVSGHISSVFKEELRKLPAGRKRGAGNPPVKLVETPRPKRGKQSSNSDGHA